MGAMDKISGFRKVEGIFTKGVDRAMLKNTWMIDNAFSMCFFERVFRNVPDGFIAFAYNAKLSKRCHMLFTSYAYRPNIKALRFCMVKKHALFSDVNNHLIGFNIRNDKKRR